MKNLLASVSLATLVLFAPLPHCNDGQFGTSAAFAQSVVNVEKVTIGSGAVIVTIPRMTVEGSSASEADIRAMFDPKALDQLTKRFAAFTARSITIPEIFVAQTIEGNVTTTMYRNIVMRDIKNGVIAEVMTSQMSSKTAVKPGSKPGPQVETSSVDMVMKGLNITLMARYLTDKAQPGETLQTALVEQTIGKTLLKLDKSEVTINKITMSDLKLKPLNTPLMQTLESLDASKKDNEKNVAPAARDFLGSFSVGNMEANGISGTIVGDDKKTGRFSLDKIRMAGGGSVSAGFAMQGLKIDSTEAKIGLGEFVIDGIKYPQLAATSVSSSDKSEFKPEEFIPTIAHFRFAGIDVDVPDTKDKAKRTKAKLGQFDVKMGNHIGPIPTNIAILLDRLQMDIPADTNEKGLKDILALGYKALDVSMRYDQAYDMASKTLKLNELSLTSVGMFAAQAKAELTNVTKEIFTLDKAVASVAALWVMAKSVSISVKNDSLFEKLIAQQAAGQKRKPEDVRAELAAGATMMVPMFLGEHPGAQALGAAMGKFLADPKNIKVDLTAKSGGIGAVDFLALKNPVDILRKVDITAASNQ
jgi:hypothetical protein